MWYTTGWKYVVRQSKSYFLKGYLYVVRPFFIIGRMYIQYTTLRENVYDLK